MSTFREALLHLAITDPHIDEHDGRTYETPSIITDDRKENDPSGLVQG